MKKWSASKGYYIALALCVAFTITVGYITRSRNKEEKNAEKLQEAVVADNNFTKPLDEALPSMTQKAVYEEKKTEVNEGKRDVPIEEKKEEVMILPVKGEIIKPFNNTELVFSETLKDWRTHPGVDIKAPIGEQVVAVLSGTVESVNEDDAYGITIVISHENGIKSQYSNLSTDKMVKVGQVVGQGDVISGVGESALCEINEEAHLHFAILKDGEYINPGI